MKRLFLFLTIFSVISLFSCKTPDAVGAKKQDVTARNSHQTVEGGTESNIPLDQYLRKISGLTITGTGSSAKVRIVGMNRSLSTGVSPLFVLDGVRIGTDLGSVSALVQTSTIKQVQVLKSAGETAFYGIQGANGVILIQTKR